MRIAADKNQFAGSHGRSNYRKHKMLVDKGHELRPTPLPFGDYCLITDEMEETIKRRGDKLKKQDLVGDIKVSLDSKKDLLEVCGNLCSSSHERFRDEIILAQKVGAKMVILVEEPGIKSVEDVFSWVNPRLKDYNLTKYMQSQGKWMSRKLPKSPPTKGSTLAKAMITCSNKYGVIWQFCSPHEAADRIVEILGSEEK